MNKTINLEKKKQRHLSAKKRAIIFNSIKVKKDNLNSQLINNSWIMKSKVIASFLSIKTEISTKFLNKFILENNKILCLPVIEENNKGSLKFYSYKENDKLLIGKFGVKEPLKSKPLLPDIIFVPCLAYDKNGFRLGYGGGYYDKTIAYFHEINHKFLSIGFAYHDQEVNVVAHDHLDQKLNYILTEKQLYEFL